jgi:hypothetical protein
MKSVEVVKTVSYGIKEEIAGCDSGLLARAW